VLGNPPAGASSLLSSIRSLLAVRYRSLVLGAVIIAANIALGVALSRTRAGWLPIIASSIASAAIFTLRGTPFSGSIGGTLLEVASAAVNISTIYTIYTMIRLARHHQLSMYPHEFRPAICNARLHSRIPSA
jgi:hypothetical protein